MAVINPTPGPLLGRVLGRVGPVGKGGKCILRKSEMTANDVTEIGRESCKAQGPDAGRRPTPTGARTGAAEGGKARQVRGAN